MTEEIMEAATPKNTRTATRQPKKQAPVQIGDNVLVRVKSGFYGKLCYRNTITNEMTIWEHIGDVQIMSMRDLREMKATQVSFFKNQWIILLGVADGEACEATPADLYRSLIVTQYYENFIDPTTFDKVCGWTVEEIEERVPMMSDGVKDNLCVALNEFIRDGRLDSIKKIKAFEKALDRELYKVG